MNASNVLRKSLALLALTAGLATHAGAEPVAELAVAMPGVAEAARTAARPELGFSARSDFSPPPPRLRLVVDRASPRPRVVGIAFSAGEGVELRATGGYAGEGRGFEGRLSLEFQF